MAQAKLSLAAKEKRRMLEILKILKREYPESQCSLYFSNPYQLLMATILSAQCTDARVNQVTPVLFKRFPHPVDLANANLKDIEAIIHSLGFYRSKARSLQETSKALVEEHGGVVPRELEALIKLRGVGRKIANVVLGVGYGVPGLVVDTHVKRLSFRLGFTLSKDPVKIEQELMKVVPKNDWIAYTHLMIDHGRKICTARRAFCEDCSIQHLCPKVGLAARGVGPFVA